MQSSADQIVYEARRWIGTPYHHQAQLRGVGVDCVGLILGVGKALDIMGPDVDERFKSFNGYSRVPNPARMRKGMETFLAPTDLPADKMPPPGVVGWFQWRDDLPMHLAIIAEFEGRATMIHSYLQIGKCVEHTLDQIWLDRVNSFWRFPGHGSGAEDVRAALFNF